MDVFECVDPIKYTFRQFQSLLDSFVFEVGESFAIQDHLKTELSIKRFRNRVNSFVKEMDCLLDKFQTDACRIDVSRVFQENEQNTLELKSAIESLKRERSRFENENATLKNKIKNIECGNFEKEEIILKLEQDLENLTSSNDKKIKLISDNEKNVNQEREFLKEVIKLKDQENKNLKREKTEIQNEIKKQKEEERISTLLIKQYGQEVVECKSQIERCKNLEKVDQRNLIDTKIRLNKTNDRLKLQEDQLFDQEDQLKLDFDLISKLKNELINVQGQIQSLSEKNSSLSLDIAEERKANCIIFKDMECLQAQFGELNNSLTSLTKKNSNLKEKKTKLTAELENVKKELTDQLAKSEECQRNIAKTEADLASFKLKFESIAKQNNHQCKEIMFLQTARSIADDKIRLLNHFIEDFRVVEKDLHNKLISENHSIRSRMNSMKQAYEQLF